MEREYLLKIAKQETYKAGEYVFYSSEENGTDFYIVEEGELILNLNSGKEKIYKRGDLFGEVSVLNGRPRMGTIKATSDVRLFKFSGEALYNEDIIPSKVALSILKGLANYIVGYLDEEYLHSTHFLIEKGEGVRVEFKESISKTLKPSIINTICAFLNTRGGSILIGIKDDGQVKGLNIKSEKEIDNYKQSIVQILKDKVGARFTTNINFNTDKIKEKLILRINCFPAQKPAILEKKGAQIFYMRSGPSNIAAPNIKEILSYYSKRFVEKQY